MKPEDFEGYWYEDHDYDEDGNSNLYRMIEIPEPENNYRVDLWEYRYGYTTPGKTFEDFMEAVQYGRKKLKTVQQVRIVDLKSKRPYPSI